MSFVEKLKVRAKKDLKTVILAEACDIRHIEAAKILQEEKVLKKIILLGKTNEVNSLAKQVGLKLDDSVSIIDVAESKNKDKYIELLFEKRKAKGMTLDKAAELINNETIYGGAAMLTNNEADGMVAGSLYTTGEVLKSALYLVGLEKGIKTLSSVFFMVHPNEELFTNGVFCFADCSVIPDPTSEQLADIAQATAKSYRQFVGDDPKVALLSFSSKGSAKHELVDKVAEAADILTQRNVDFIFEGEVQFDTAMIESVSKHKTPNSNLKGEANIFVFPDLNAGNISYKIAQRLGGCSAIGPMLQGIAKPVNDLSRGCSAKDIVDLSIITALQSAK